MLLYLLLFFSLIIVLWVARYFSKIKRNALIQQNNLKYIEGLSLALNNKHDQAIDVFQEILTSNKSMPEAHIMLGNLFRQQGYVEKAIKIHNALLLQPELNKNIRYLVLHELARDYFDSGMLDRAEHLLTELLKKKKLSKDGILLLLEVYEQSKDWQTAIDTAELIKKNFKVDLSHRVAQYHCELACLVEGYDKDSIKNKEGNLKKALKKESSCPRAMMLLGNLYCARGNYSQALSIYKRLLENNTVYMSEVIFNMAECYLNLNKSEELLGFLRSVLKEQPSLTTMLYFSDRLLKEKGPNVALKFIIASLKDQPSIRGISRALQLFLRSVDINLKPDVQELISIADDISKEQYPYNCYNCGFKGKKLEWLCPSCHNWETIKPNC